MKKTNGNIRQGPGESGQINFQHIKTEMIVICIKAVHSMIQCCQLTHEKQQIYSSLPITVYYRIWCAQ